MLQQCVATEGEVEGNEVSNTPRVAAGSEPEGLSDSSRWSELGADHRIKRGFRPHPGGVPLFSATPFRLGIFCVCDPVVSTAKEVR